MRDAGEDAAAAAELAARARELLPRARALGLFATAARVFAARAPGRLDLMGGIADYSGSLVLQLPLDVATVALAAPRADGVVRVVSLGPGDAVRDHAVALAALYALAEPGQATLRANLQAAGATWFAYLAGILPVLAVERGARATTGVDLLVASDVPEGKGVSSSASVEVASASALIAALALRPALGQAAGEVGGRLARRRALALLCQRVENEVAGAACGVMDQMAVACGRRGRILRLRCQPAEVEGYVALPEGLAVWGIDSGVRHAVSGSDYTSVRIGTFMGWRIVADLLDVEVHARAGGVAFSHPRWGSHLADLPPSSWQALRARVPETMRGDEFLSRYHGTSDPATSVDPARTYAVRQPTAHAIEEHHRVRTFAALLPHAHDPGAAELLGELMAQSHASYSACGLGSDATDALAEAVRAAGPAHGLFGAKITGGGSGGTVAVLGRAEADQVVRAIAGSRGVLTAALADGAPVLVETEVGGRHQENA